MILRCVAGALVLALQVHAAEIPWSVNDAPLRASFRATQPPGIPDAGWLLELPELGLTTPTLGDVILTDNKGAQLPLAKVFRNEGDRVVLIAQNLTKDQEVFVYFGGSQVRPELKWTPRLSLFLETRRLPADSKMDDWPQLEAAWNSASEIDGGGFVSAVFHGENPFGESANFLSHYTGLLRLPEKKITLYTVSSDASFVLANNRPVFGWPGKHGPQTNEMTAPRGEVTTPDDVVPIDYYHAKDGPDPTMLLGWIRDGRLEAIPPDAWIHPGVTEQISLGHLEGWPIAQPIVRVDSYLGYGDRWFYETHGTLKTPLPEGWSARWEWNDGAVFDGAECRRVCVGPAPTRVTVRLSNSANQTTALKVIKFGGQTPAASIQNARDVQRYLDLLGKEDPAKLNPSSLVAQFALAAEFGSDPLVARYGAAWTAKNTNPTHPLWLTAQLARLRSLSQTNPKAAIADLHNFDAETRKKFPQLPLLELDILVFGLKSPDAIPLAERITTENAELARLAKIRIGDLYRLRGETDQARTQYAGVSGSPDSVTPEKLALTDRAMAMTIDRWLAQGDRNAAASRLADWELVHPLAKYESEYLLLRGRTLLLYGRANEAREELESFRAIRTDAASQVPADFYRAHALAALDRKEEARKLWTDLAANHPNHPLAAEAAQLAK
jgi:hypothetical protein